MSEGNWLTRKFAGGFAQGLGSLLFTYLYPIAAPAIAVLFGKMNEIPLFWIWLVAIATFAIAVISLVYLDELQRRRRVKGRLVFSSVNIVRSVHNLNNLVFGIQVKNLANFQIDFKMVKMITKLEDRVPAKQDWLEGPTEIEVPMQGGGWFYDDEICVTNPPKPGPLKGFIEFELIYGRPGNMKYSLSGKKCFYVMFDEHGEVTDFFWRKAS